MGEVYLATDAHLKRQVAIKVLPDAVASDPERMARFQREAEVLAAINHPNIAQIYGFEKTSGTLALVMELVEGPTLADLIAGSGTLPLDDALPIARQIAQALDFAHERGIVHRDLKPANIKVRDDATVKVLDFGLAKLSDPNPASNPSLTMSPTLSVHATIAGVILGTAAYMSPEQARGKVVDKRTDIWAFGCVLFEMLTGERLFRGEDLTETLASIVKDQPDFSKAPRQVQRLLRKCLEKDPKKRLRDLGDIEELIEDRPAATPAPAARGSWLPWAVAGVLAVALAGGSFVYLSQAPAPTRRMHLFVPLPDNLAPGFFAIAPDGRSIVMSYQGKLGIRSLESGELRTLSGTDGARAPFWSGDSRSIGFLSSMDRKLKSVAAAGGVPQVLCDEVSSAVGGTWNRDGTILVTARAALMRVSAAGGTCTGVPNPEGAITRTFPVFLPDGEHFLFFQAGADEARTGIFVASLRDPGGKRLLADGSSALFVPDAPGATRGRLLFVRENTLMAQAFDTVSLDLSGDPSPVASNVRFTLNPPQIAASAADDGTLLYLANSRADRQLIWYDRAGAEVSRGAVTGLGGGISLSPDGKRIAFHKSEPQGVAIWIEDLERRQETRLTDPAVYSGPAAWSADSQRVAYLSLRGPLNARESGFFVKGVNSASEQVIAGQRFSATEQVQRYVSDWSRDARWLIYSAPDPKTGSDIWLVPAAASSATTAPVPLLRTAAGESQGQLSPDLKWLAYSSDEGGGVSRVFIRPFNGAAPLLDAKWQVSSSSVSAREPRWRADSKELFFLESPLPANHPRVMAVPIGAAPDPVGTPRALFAFQTILSVTRTNIFAYAPSPDGQRFVVDAFASRVEPTLEVILNWAGGR